MEDPQRFGEPVQPLLELAPEMEPVVKGSAC